MYCPKCGAMNDASATLCSRCGAPLSGATAVPAQPGKGLAIASLVCGIVSFFCFGFILGLLAVIFGGVAKNKGYRGGMATAGIVLGVVGLACYLIVIFVCYGGALLPAL